MLQQSVAFVPVLCTPQRAVPRPRTDHARLHWRESRHPARAQPGVWV